MGGSSSGTTTTRTEPWEGLIPYLLGQPAQEATPDREVRIPGSGGDAHDSQNVLGPAGQGRPGTITVPGTPAQEAIPGLLPEAARLYEQGLSIPGFNANQLAGQQSALEAAGTVGGLIPTINQSLTRNLNATDIENNPALNRYLDAAINPLIDRFNEDVIPRLATSSVNAGQFGGTRQGVGEGIYTGRLFRQTGDIRADILNNAYNAGLQAENRALALSPSILSTNLLPSQITSSVGDAQRNLQMQQENADFQNLANYASLLSGNFGGASTGPAPSGPGAFQGALGGAAMGASLTGGNPYGMAAGAILGMLFGTG